MMRIHVVGSVALAAPWNGADKNIARLLVNHDPENQFVVQTGVTDEWPHHVCPVRSKRVGAVPTPLQKLRALDYFLRHAGTADLVHVLASLQRPHRGISVFLRAWSERRGIPIVHTAPSTGDGVIGPQSLFGAVTVVMSQYTRSRLAESGIPDVFRVYPPVDPANLEPTNEGLRFTRALDLGRRAVLYAGHYGEQSGIPEIIEAFAQLPTEVDDAVLVFACRTRVEQNARLEEERVLSLAVRAGIERRVRVVRDVPDMGALISSCAVSALVPGGLGSKLDLPLVLLESLTLERPIIVSDVPPMNEALLGGAGFAVRYGDVSGLASAVARLLLDTPLRTHMGRQGRAAVLEYCNPAAIVSQYHTIYERALTRGSQRRREPTDGGASGNVPGTGEGRSPSRVLESRPGKKANDRDGTSRPE